MVLFRCGGLGEIVRDPVKLVISKGFLLEILRKSMPYMIAISLEVSITT